MESMRNVRLALRQLQEEQTYQANRDAMHLASTFATRHCAFSSAPDAAAPAANESTARRALAYSILEAVGLLAMSVGQARS